MVTLCAAVLMGSLLFGQPEPPLLARDIPAEARTVQASIGSRRYTLELARTVAERARGLSGRDSLPRDRGMLFILKRPGKYIFSMGGMRFPLDFIWLRDDRVVGLLENAPEEKGERDRDITCQEIFNLAIELNAGEIRQNGVKVGDRVSFY